MKSAIVSAAELREAFDRSFGDAHVESPLQQDLLAIQVAGLPHALRASEIDGLFVDRIVTPLPSRQPGLIGIASFRAVVLPVFDLAILLGHPASGTPRWTVVAGRGSFALAFDTFDAYLRMQVDDIVPRRSADPAHVAAVVRVHGVLRPVIALDTLLAALSAPLQETR